MAKQAVGFTHKFLRKFVRPLGAVGKANVQNAKAFCVQFFAILLGVAGIVGALSLSQQTQKTVLLNVAYDVIRDFYHAYNPLFRQLYQTESTQAVMISQSHAGASKQVIAVANGLPADVVTLTQSNDIELLVQRGLVEPDWQTQYPNHATPFGSVMVFLVRKGNPKQIHDWHDLTRKDVSVIFANPKTSANGRFAYLSAFAYAKRHFAEPNAFMQQLLANVPVLEAGARGATIAFSQRQLGDVLITPENEAALAAQSLGDAEFEVVYPSLSAYTPVLVAEVAKNSRRNGTQTLAKAYLNYLWSEPAQELAAQQFFRPSNHAVLAKYAKRFPAIQQFDLNQEFGHWAAINAEHFADNALFDRLYIAAKSQSKEAK